MMTYLCVTLYLVTIIEAAHPGLRHLRYAVFTSGAGSAFDSSGSIPAIELAEEEINNNPTILQGYVLHHSSVEDTLCSRTNSLDLFFATVAEAHPSVLGLVGCGCSVASEPVAEIIHHWNISQVAYSSGSVIFSNRQRFRNIFRTNPSYANTFHAAISSVLKFYGWNRILMITEDHDVFSEIYESLYPVLMMSNITVKNRMVPNTLQELEHTLGQSDFFYPNEDIRVILINSYSNVARIVICEAIKMHGLDGYPRYVWITYSWYQDRWWTPVINNDPIRCDVEDLVQLLKRSLILGIVPFPDDPDASTDVGQTANGFLREYRRRLENYTYTYVASYAYDAVWSLALALNSTASMLRWPKSTIINTTNCEDDGKDLEGLYLDDFTYNHTFIGCVIKWNIAQTNFFGVSGYVTFDGNGTRKHPLVTIEQYQFESEIQMIERVKIGHINELKSYRFEYINSFGNDTVFPDGVPSDGTPIEVVVTYHLVLVVTYYTLASLGLIFTTVCLIFNFTFRKRKIVRLSSPNLNYLIIVGCYLMYASIFVRMMPSTSEVVNYIRCNVQALLNTLAFCLSFGTVLVKMGRVYHIFHNPTKMKKAALKDWHMALTVLGITGVGAMIAVLGLVVPGLRAIPSLQPDQERLPAKDEQGVRIKYLVWLCTVGNNSKTIYIVLFFYILILQIIGVVLAIQTRKVKVKALNDSKFIAILVYIFTIGWVLCGLTIFILPWNTINITEMVFSSCFLLVTTIFLAFTFVPKMVSLYRDPSGETVFRSTVNSKSTKPHSASIRSTADRGTELEARIKQLESRLEETKSEPSKI